ncbi:hypothetical protein F7725_005529 [Dissostichus mawsoni]|uniref:Uncharacterized protein n=1 Tax=Dissostichus mawsoni TaxID=36200 RepID=A0A7J5YRI8_DISMA|nr:hypothetical protein F7725_005529 [Dissostichus mawsoni]
MIPKPYMNKKEGNKEGQIVKEKKDRRSADGKISQLEVETKVDGKEDGEEELHFHTTCAVDSNTTPVPGYQHNGRQRHGPD